MQIAFWQVKPLFFPHWHDDSKQGELIATVKGHDTFSIKVVFENNNKNLKLISFIPQVFQPSAGFQKVEFWLHLKYKKKLNIKNYEKKLFVKFIQASSVLA